MKIILILLAAFSVPFLIWLFSAFTKFANNQVDPRRNAIAYGFLVSITLFSLIDNFLLKLPDSYSLFILASIIIAFASYMLIVVIRDKRGNHHETTSHSNR
jgi:predicted acyltransferase